MLTEEIKIAECKIRVLLCHLSHVLQGRKITSDSNKVLPRPNCFHVQLLTVAPGGTLAGVEKSSIYRYWDTMTL